MPVLLPSDEVSLKKLLLRVRGRLPSNAARLTVADDSEMFSFDDERHFVSIKLPDSPFYCRVYKGAFEAYPHDHMGMIAIPDWEELLQQVEKWAFAAYVEYDALQELKLINAEFGSAAVDEYANAPDGQMFTEAERAQIDVDLMAFASQVGARFDALKSQVGAMDAKMAQQQQQILDAIERIRTSSEKLSKKDWSNAVLSTTMAMVASAVVPPEVIQAIVRDLLGQLAHLKLLTAPP